MAIWKVFYDKQEIDYAGEIDISEDSSLNEALEQITQKFGESWMNAYPENTDIKVLKDI